MKIRTLGLWSSVAASLALAITAFANNRTLGFGHTITRRNQFSLLAAAIILCIPQLVLYLIAHGKEDKNAKRNKRP
jgi:hypothetical protein